LHSKSLFGTTSHLLQRNEMSAVCACNLKKKKKQRHAISVNYRKSVCASLNKNLLEMFPHSDPTVLDGTYKPTEYNVHIHTVHLDIMKFV